MAENLLMKVAVGEIDSDLLKKWLISNSQEYFQESSGFNCTKSEFLTYFLNFIHEEIPRQVKQCESPLRELPPRQVKLLDTDDIEIKKRLNYSEMEKMDVTKSSTFPPPVNRSLENSFDKVSMYNSITDTPKVSRIHSETDINSSYLSPVSPLYKSNCSFSTPKNKQCLDKVSPLCLGDFIVSRKSSIKKKSTKVIVNREESTKRITPTCLSQLSVNCDFGQTINSFNNFNTHELSSEHVSETRINLVEERLKILLRKNSAENQTLETSKIIGSSTYKKMNVDPYISNVTYKIEIDNIAQIYLSILQNNLVLNITSEIYFLISLLSSKQYMSSDISKHSDDTLMGIEFLNDEEKIDLTDNKLGTCSDYFESIHNIIYFTVKCLECQLHILKYYDKSTLKILSSNERLKCFSSNLSAKLQKISDKKSERTVDITADNLQTNVCFNLDTDNRDNFPNDVTFHAFRKQRDLFYEILQVWETNHLQPSWNFSMGLTGKIKTLFAMQNEPVNFMHFARLFKAQLMGTHGKSQRLIGLSVEQIPFLSSLPNIDANKLSRLKNRLVTKQASAGLNSVPLFTGYQEFYKDFIVIASNHTFNAHLSNTLILEIMDLNDSKFLSSDLEDSDKNTDFSTRESFFRCIMHLRLLAKFLGFISSLPYKSEQNSYPDSLLVTQIRSRQETAPHFDVKELLVNSVKDNTIVLSIPWITKYLSMLDFVTLRLPYYISLYQILFQIYRTSERPSRKGFDYNSSLVKFCLGWLFELPHFPEDAYFNFCLDDVAPRNKHNKKLTLDDLDIVDQNILYRCCPYLEEIKKLLTSNVSNNSVTVKHITPVTSVRSSQEMTKKKLELQLEEAFFNGQPMSVRRTVEFISERVASACIKHICSSVVPESKVEARERLQRILDNWRINCRMVSPLREKSQKAALRLKVNQLAKTSLGLLRDQCGVSASDIMKTKIPPSVESLLAIDCLCQMKRVCISIASKMCQDRVRQWITSHVTMNIFLKDFDNEVQKVFNQENKRTMKDKAVFALPPGGKDKAHNDDCLSAFHLLERIKLFSVDVLEQSEAVNRKETENLLQVTIETLAGRCDVNESITSYICMSIVDLALLLIIHRPDIMPSDDLTMLSIEVWKYYFREADDLFKNLLCPRNILMLAQSCNDAVVWKNFAIFVAFLTKENVITSSNIESQCIGFYKKDWDQSVLQNVSLFLKYFIERHKENGGDVNKFTLLMEFLSEYCIDL